MISQPAQFVEDEKERIDGFARRLLVGGGNHLQQHKPLPGRGLGANIYQYGTTHRLGRSLGGVIIRMLHRRPAAASLNADPSNWPKIVLGVAGSSSSTAERVSACSGR